MKDNMQQEIIDLILKKKKGVSAATAAKAFNKIKEALKAMEDKKDE